jgi:hypothetical protein
MKGIPLEALFFKAFAILTRIMVLATSVLLLFPPFSKSTDVQKTSRPAGVGSFPRDRREETNV